MMAVGSLSLASCSDNDDDAPQNDNPFVGTYRIASWNAPVPQDLNADGTASANLITEYDCYDNAEITLNEDHTFTRTYSVVDAFDGNLTCQSGLVSTGNWVRNGQSIMLSNTDGGTEADNTYTFSADNQILTHTGAGQYPMIFENIFIMESGTITVVYAKVDAEN